jgi:tRNA (adenine57-N1/adenine58-N1)-methyltransferase
MSILQSTSFIREGDLVVLFGGKDDMHSIRIARNQIFNGRFGHFHHNDLIGLPYGSRVYSKKGAQGHMLALLPTADLWSSVLRHRTQILYPTDNSVIIFNLEVKPGSRVVESGTGSGSLSTFFIRALAPTGHLFTYEFHQGRAEYARKEFEENGLSNYVTVTHRDVVQHGFLQVEGVLEESIDAVFLDLPAPWEVIQQ